MPDALPIGPVAVVLLGQSLASGYLALNWVSIVSLFCWAVCGGFDVPLAIRIMPSPLGLCSWIVLLSLLITVHPDGSGTDSAALDAVVPPVGCVGSDDGDGEGDCDGAGVVPGDGVNAGLGLERDLNELA